MSIGKRVQETIDAMDANDPEAALQRISSAIETTAEREGKGDKAGFKDFLHRNLGFITDIAFGGKRIENIHLGNFQHDRITLDDQGCCTIQDIFYHAVRCGLYHASELPANLRFTDEGQIRNENGCIVLPSSLIYGLIAVVVLSPANAKETASKNPIFNFFGVMPLLVNRLWGERERFEWVYEIVKDSIAFQEQQAKP